MKIIYTTAFIFLFITNLLAQKNKNNNSILYTNVTIHIGNGQVIESGMLGVKNGKIDLVETMTATKLPPYSETIDGKGQHIYPSLIAPNTKLGLEEVAAVRSTRDYREVGKFNPNIRSIIAYNTDSKIIPTVRSNGILIAQIVPQGGRISGQSSIAYTEAYNWEDAALRLDNGVHLRWPMRVRYAGWWAAKGSTFSVKHYDRDLRAIKVYFDAAKAYAQREKVEKKNLKFETMKLLFAKKKKLFVHADDAKEIMDAILLLQTYDIDIVIQGGADAWKITDFLQKTNVPIILNNIHSLPRRDDEDINQPYRTASILQQKDILFCFSLQGSWQVRNLAFQAGQSVAYGLDKEQALKALTLSTAHILGINDRVGSLQIGKDATFIVSEGDILDMRTSVITAAFIEGKTVDLGNKQKELYSKYMNRYDLKE